MPILTRRRRGARRYAGGIDLDTTEVRLAILSRGGSHAASVRVEWFGAAPLEPAWQGGAAPAEREAAASALARLVDAWPGRHGARAVSYAMALPGSAVFRALVPAARHPAMTMTAAALSDAALPAMEPLVRAQAERVTGFPGDTLALDWSLGHPVGVMSAGASSHAVGDPSLMIAAAQRQWVEMRVEVAAAAGVVLDAVDAEPLAACRALCRAAALERQEGDAYAAVWIGADGFYAWRVEHGTPADEIHCAAGGDPVAALRGLSGSRALARAIVAGDLDRLEGYGLTLADIGDALGCTVSTFDCAAFVDGSVRGQFPHACGQPRAAAFAVAFGLALRGEAP
ncbi:pilus assembly protein PilM [Trinickia caryophylli]|uniref:Type IV pilus assembly protein PilM n=1 Tax=Trinickia caryophylli TaxID=28094 RepID=A0A1X7F667_TRICW|nr:pilus assembly protein PilM [Trinickia caryophylli]PMS08703.1 pilus assembly protein PilM [Trinickia caryophylli]TRX19413.1 pilus assembly protein PilM [Trinickia caryophylli]WQE13280.1 pilus assembly protein PilM [Trinickia caryophylli]SMF46044.1 Type IV pilus assembly protein PilM [Trinickia caryophylli]GLU34399.1 hypothetical protein Busp01_42410 [Trinickia caryophylli]